MDTIIELGKVTEETKGLGGDFAEAAPPDDECVALQETIGPCG